MEVLKTMGNVDLFPLLVNKISQVVPATTNVRIFSLFHNTVQQTNIAYIYDRHSILRIIEHWSDFTFHYTDLPLSWFCLLITSAAPGCSICSSWRASWLTTATLEAVAFISCSKLSKRCFMMAISSMSSVMIMVVKNFSCFPKKNNILTCHTNYKIVKKNSKWPHLQFWTTKTTPHKPFHLSMFQHHQPRWRVCRGTGHPAASVCGVWPVPVIPGNGCQCFPVCSVCQEILCPVLPSWQLVHEVQPRYFHSF